MLHSPIPANSVSRRAREFGFETNCAAARNVHVIINPTAGGGRAGKRQAGLLSSIKRRFGATIDTCTTSAPGEATRYARIALERGCTLLLVAGGDGTIQEAVNGLFENGIALSPDCELGILSCGTGRGFAGSVGLPHSVQEQLDQIVTCPSRLIDVGRVRHTDTRGNPAERLFVNECQVGIGGAVVRAVGMGHKRLGGTIGFGLAAVSELMRSSASRMRVRFDDGSELEDRLLGLVVGNGALCGGGMRLTPRARPDDGLLDAVLIRSMSLLTRLWSFPRIYRGEHTRLEQVSSHRCRRMTIDSDQDMQLEADGEWLGCGPCEIDVLPAALRVRGTRLPATNSKQGRN